MRSFVRVWVTAVLSLVPTLAYATGYVVSTDRVGYTGTVTRYASLDDALGATNPLGTYAMPSREGSTSRDFSIYASQDYPSIDALTYLSSAWWYTTIAGGINTPSNSNSGFLQLYDVGNDTVTATDASFGDYDGQYYTSLTLTLTGADAKYNTEYGRLWAAPREDGAANTTRANFISYDLDMTFTGLQGQASSTGIVATNHPTGVNGTLNAVVQNVGTDPSLNGYYVASFMFNMNSWAYNNRSQLVGDPLANSYFATAGVPEPATMGLLAIGAAAFLRRRCPS